MGVPFQDVFEAEYEIVRGYLYRRLRSAEADDLAAETFAIAYRRWSDLDASRPVRPWLYGISANLLRHHWRKERRMLRSLARSGIDPLAQTEDESGVEGLDARARAKTLAMALLELRPAEREVLLLHAWADLTDAEISQALSIPIGTVKSRLHRARGTIRNRLHASGQFDFEDLSTSGEEH